MSPFFPTPEMSLRRRTFISEVLLVDPVAGPGGPLGGLGGRRPAGGRGCPRLSTVAGPLALVLRHLGGRPPQAGTDLVRDDLHLRALVAVLGLPRPLLEAAGHDDARAAGETLRRVLGHLTPAHDVEERRGLFPFLGLAILPPPVHSH